jgi:hypothetical protein
MESSSEHPDQFGYRFLFCDDLGKVKLPKSVWVIVGCVAFAGWTIPNGSTDRKAHINGILAVRKRDFDIEILCRWNRFGHSIDD